MQNLFNIKYLHMFKKEFNINGCQIYYKNNYRYMSFPVKTIKLQKGIFEFPIHPDINVGKYYYLKVLSGIAKMPKRVPIFKNILDWIYVNTQPFYDNTIVEMLIEQGLKLKDVGIAPFFTIIYLSMLDLEIDSPYPIGSGKKIVYESCIAVLLKNYDFQTAANMFSKKHNTM